MIVPKNVRPQLVLCEVVVMNLIVHKECSGACFWSSPITGDDYDTIQDIDVYSIYEEVVESFLWFF